MKRCIVCGSEAKDTSKFCEVCGNPFPVVTEEQPGMDIEYENEESAESPEVEAFDEEPFEPGDLPEQMQPAVEAPQNTVPAGAQDEQKREARKMKSGPQIYGQEGISEFDPNAYGQQGVIRRSVHGGETQGMNPQQESARRPERPRRESGEPNFAVGNAPKSRQGGKQSYQASMIMETSRKALRSPLFFLIVILNTAFVAGSVAAVFMQQLNYSQFVRLISAAELPAQFSGYADTAISYLKTLDQGHIMINVATHIPDMIFCLGLWLVFICALAARKQKMSGIGFLFMKLIVLLQMIASCAVVLLCLVVSVAFVIASWVSESQTTLIISVVILVSVIVITMFVIMYFFCYFASIKACKLNSTKGESYGKVSSYVAVIHIIGSLFSIVTILSGVVNEEITNIVSGAGGLGWMFFFGVWLLRYKSKMKKLNQ